ncbi:MAG: sigma-70 family RNA polymerase sigma factor [Planctomycetales bacterium]|nr:sigma-70 family RNA polymerase sigma factor [Planctomycetales bacterium]
MWPESQETQELIVQARSDQAGAVDQLLERHRASVKRLIQLRLDHGIRRRVDVSDVLQEVMLEASRRLSDYLASPPMSFHLWLRQIAMDRIIDAHRRHRGSAKRSVDREQAATPAEPSALDWVQQLADPRYTPATAAARREMAKCVEEMISQLPDQDAEILVMRHFEQLTNQEVAQSLGLSEPAASMRYLRAIRRLREALESAFPGSTNEGA